MASIPSTRARSGRALLPLTGSCLLLLAASLLGGCDRVLDMIDGLSSDSPQRAQRQTPSSPSAPDVTPSTTTSEKERYIQARAEISCALLQGDRARHADTTQAIISKHGFNQMTFAAATHRYREDPEVTSTTDALYEQCKIEVASLPEPKQPEAQVETPSADAGETDIDQHQDPTEAMHEALERFSQSAGGGKMDPADETTPGVGEPETDQEVLYPTPHVGSWVGNFSGALSGTISLTVQNNGLISGQFRSLGRRPQTFTLQGTQEGSVIRLRSQESEPAESGSSSIELVGTLQPQRQVITGNWTGSMQHKPVRGTWRAASR